jgi:hypothetical protein
LRIAAGIEEIGKEEEHQACNKRRRDKSHPSFNGKREDDKAEYT